MRSGAPAPLLAMAFNIVLCNLTTTGPTTRTEHLHHHHDWGPHVESSEGGNVSVRVGQTATLDCRVQLLHDKTVSWVRRRPGSEELQLLTVGRQTYSGDERYAVSFQYPDNWRLTVKDSRPADQGDYECQVSTHPPRTVRYNLVIRAPEVEIVDERGRPLSDKYYEPNSTIQLSCVARRRQPVTWRHGDVTLNYGTPRGGISVRTDLSPAGANSSLLVARIGSGDAGNYTCSVSPSEFATVTVHVLDGEHPAELHLSLSPTMPSRWPLCSLLLLLALVLRMGS
ncbi:uncharacterized protein LOC126176985 [Schistocerca cancellata]|uniref:uncharacterized protein LOC126176985 n=1 Tax=Schistocerca cancellata TaxID=274614 RepID=UPI0021190370|nr:uncharacterized protein LOC126176985 [Schistocerca cancellata]